MKEIFEKILAIDERAKKVAAGEGKTEENVDAEIEKKLAQMKKDIDDKYSVDLISEIEKDKTDAKMRIAELKKAVEKQKKALDECAGANHEKWVDEIVKEIIS